MDPFSLTVGIVGLITSFKEVCLLSQCLYKACESAVASDEERASLREDMRCELNFVRSFGRFYLQNSSITGDVKLDDHWSRIIYEIFEELRKSLNDYKKIDDPQYIQFSPYANESMYNTKQIEFPLEDELPQPVVPVKKKSVFSFIKARAKDTTIAAGKSAKWALFEKRKLETSVAIFRKGTQKLRGMLPLAQSAQFSRLEDKVGALTATILDHDANRLGVSLHAKVIEYQDASPESFTDVNEKDHVVRTISNDPELRIATVEWNRLGSEMKEEESVLVELKYYLASNKNAEPTGPDTETEVNVRRLAGLLQITSSGSNELRTLPFKYYVHQPAEKRYAFLFGYPLYAEQSQPLSLHELITSPNLEHQFALAARFRVAQMIAQSIAVFHADDWVHKSVRSESVVFFQDRAKGTLMLDSPYLVDFGYSRPEKGLTYAPSGHQVTDATTLYLHPDRPRKPFKKVHDIYALGVVLLEIATWRVANDYFAKASGALDLETTSIDREELRRKFLSIAKKKIPHLMGVAYMEAVVACLDDTYRGQTENSDFAETFQSDVIEKLSPNQLLS